MFAALLPIVGNLLGGVLNHFFPNPEDELKRQQIQNEFFTKLIDQAQAIELAGAENIKQEAASSHWLAANWRPITMLTFLVLIVCRMFGLTNVNISTDEYDKLWTLVQIGLGGYTVGRSVEKIAPMISDALKGKKS